MPESEEPCGRVRRRGGGAREREREEGRQVVPHGVPRHPTMRGCGPLRVEREGEAWDEAPMKRKGVAEAVGRGRRYM